MFKNFKIIFVITLFLGYAKIYAAINPELVALIENPNPDQRTFQKLLKKEKNIGPVIYEVCKSHADHVTYLQILMQNPNFKDYQNQKFDFYEQKSTPLIKALMTHNQGIAKMLLESKGIDINIADEPYKATPLFYAVVFQWDYGDSDEAEIRRARTIKEKIDIIKILLSRDDIKPNMQNRLG